VSFSSFASLGAALAGLAVELDRHAHKAMEEACVILEDDAKDAIGTYRYGWPPLGPAAVAKHGDTPLLDTGEMRDSIQHTVVSSHEGYVGTNSTYAKYQEFGTSKIPPRPFLGGAIHAKRDEVVKCFGHAIEATIKAK
jgi:HK97 gp10 family phage protein